jgi:U4/U6.U5 tri-snRNP-associated protein 3
LPEIDLEGSDEDAMAKMAAMMGLPLDFDTSQNKDHTTSEASAIHRKTVRSARQYMNRKGGFNRALPAERTGEKVKKEGLRLA